MGFPLFLSSNISDAVLKSFGPVQNMFDYDHLLRFGGICWSMNLSASNCIHYIFHQESLKLA